MACITRQSLYHANQTSITHRATFDAIFEIARRKGFQTASLGCLQRLETGPNLVPEYSFIYFVLGKIEGNEVGFTRSAQGGPVANDETGFLICNVSDMDGSEGCHFGN